MVHFIVKTCKLCVYIDSYIVYVYTDNDEPTDPINANVPLPNLDSAKASVGVP